MLAKEFDWIAVNVVEIIHCNRVFFCSQHSSHSKACAESYRFVVSRKKLVFKIKNCLKQHSYEFLLKISKIILNGKVRKQA